MNDGLDHPPGKELRPPGQELLREPDEAAEVVDTSKFKDMDRTDYQTLAYAKVTDKYKHRKYDRFIQNQRKECEKMAVDHKNAERLAFKEHETEIANRLSRELDELRKEEFKEQKLRQQLRENDHELRDLERKLKAAYVNKVLAAQIAQKEAVKLNSKIRDSETYNVMTKAWVTEQEHLSNLKREDRAKKEQYKKELQDQIILREKSKRYLYEEFLREKKLIDDVVKRIHDEDERAAAEKLQNMLRTQQEIAAFKEAQDKWKKKRMQEIEEEDRKIQEYLLKLSVKKDERAIAHAKMMEEKEKVHDKMALELAIFTEEEKERERVLQDLKEEELRIKQEERHKLEVEKKIRLKLEAKSDLETQMKEVEAKRKHDEEEDRKYKELVLAKMIEDEKLEQLTAQKRREKLIMMRKDAEKFMAERRRKHAEELQLQMGIENEANQRAEIRRKIIEEERIKMLQEHVQNLIGYLPKGVLRPEDLPHLSQEVIQSFKSNTNPSYIPPVHRKR